MEKRILNGKCVIYKNKIFDFYQNKEGLFELVDRNRQYEQLKEMGFVKYNEFVSFKIIKREDIPSAYKVVTYCNYKGWKYWLENIRNGTVYLSPELETKSHLGLHLYDDRRIEVEYEKFMEEVEEIWEERTPIGGFKFDVEPIHYIKKDGKYLE